MRPKWTDSNWPNLIVLRKTGLVCVFALFGVIVSVHVLTFCLVSIPYGWPEISFFVAVPQPQQFLVFVATISAFLLPLLISCVLYGLIYFTGITQGLNKVGIETLEEEPPGASDNIFVCENIAEVNRLKNKEK